MKKLKNAPRWWVNPADYNQVSYWEDYEVAYKEDAHATLTYDIVKGVERYSLSADIINSAGESVQTFYRLTLAEFVAFRLEGAVLTLKKGDPV